jgi:PKD repeat protein
MKKQTSSRSGFINSRNLIALLFCTASISLAILSVAAKPTARTQSVKSPGRQSRNQTVTIGAKTPVHLLSTGTGLAAPSPGNATLSTSNRSITYTESGAQVPNETGVALGVPNCTVPNSCSTFDLTINPSVSTAVTGYDPTQYQIHMTWSWSVSTVDYDIFFEDAGGSVVAANTSTADPSAIILPTTTTAGLYHVVIVLATGAPIGYTGTIVLEAKPLTSGTCGPPANCTPPRYVNYPAGVGQADNAGEPSVGVDWNPNVASLKNTSSPIFTTGVMRKNTGGVAFFTSGANEWRVNFDDCPSPAVNRWEDVTATTTQQFVLSDPIGFVDHYSSSPLGLTYPPPHTTGRVFTLDLIGGQGNSLGSYSDTDGNSYLPGGTGGPGQGPDHETLGGGPYNPNSNPPPPPQVTAYGSPNAIYYCSQNIVAEAQCSRSDDGGQTFGPGVLIYNPSQCTGGIHGHIKVAADGTVYVPNSSCGTVGTNGVALSTDNGLTWTEHNVPGTSGNQDPSVGIGQNNVGKPGGNLGGTNTIYLGYVVGNGHPYISHSGDRGANWSTPVDVGVPFAIEHAVFPVVVAGDDSRAAFGFLGTGPGIATSGSCDPYGATLNCANIWHLYIATTYDGGANWITVDATPNDAVQQGTVCLQGTTCAGGRNLLDFNDFGIDAEGRGVLGYADGCVNCNNTFQGQSSASHGTIARQSGGRRLFSHFDPIEPMPPASPQMVSATNQVGGVLVSWLEPDNGGSPITGYNIYRSTTSGAETFLAHVSGETNTKYFDSAPPVGSNAFYYARAVNGIGEGDHCGEVSVTEVPPTGNACTFPYLNVDGPGAAGTVPTDPTTGSLTIQYVDIGEPFTSCTDNSLTFLMKVATLDPGNTGQPVLPPNSEWQVLFTVKDTNGNPQNVYVELDTFSPNTPATPGISLGRRDPCSAGCGTLDSAVCTQGGTPPASCPKISASYSKDGTIQIKLDVSTPLSFAAPGAPGTGSAFTWDAHAPGAKLTSITGNTLFFVGVGAGFLETVQTTSGGSYTRVGNVSCQSNPPIAALSASPMSGPAPLMVNFNGTASHEPAGACGTINSYTLDFGDGTTPATNSTGMFSHTYNNPGEYPARLTVSDTAGLKSTNVAQVIISVAQNSIQPVAVVSRMTHGSITPPFEVNLPLTGTRGVECRSGGPNGNYTMVFEFANPLTSVGGASVTSGTGSVSSSAIGLNKNEYIVNLTGVANAQYIRVTLTNVLDSASNSGNVVGPQMGVLIGDTTANGLVNSSDIGQTQSQSGIPVTSSNFREDVTVNGAINSSDISLVQSESGTGLPSAP